MILDGLDRWRGRRNGLAAIALAAATGFLLLQGCSSDAEPVATNTDAAGVENEFPDINSVPTERPTPTITDIFSAPQGLGADTTNANHAGEAIGGPTTSADRPPPPPPPVPEEVTPAAGEEGATEPTAEGEDPAVSEEPAPDDTTDQQSSLGDESAGQTIV